MESPERSPQGLKTREVKIKEWALLLHECSSGWLSFFIRWGRAWNNKNKRDLFGQTSGKESLPGLEDSAVLISDLPSPASFAPLPLSVSGRIQIRSAQWLILFQHCSTARWTCLHSPKLIVEASAMSIDEYYFLPSPVFFSVIPFSLLCVRVHVCAGMSERQGKHFHSEGLCKPKWWLARDGDTVKSVPGQHPLSGGLREMLWCAFAVILPAASQFPNWPWCDCFDCNWRGWLYVN